jgi:two-component system LytT family response regulator
MGDLSSTCASPSMPPNSAALAVVRVCIVDDEAPGRINLRLALSGYSHWQIVGECAGAAEVRALLAHTRVDVLFLDIQMPGESGLALAGSVCQADVPPLIIFVTAHNSHAVDAFDLHALDYLIKPWHSNRFAQALARAEDMLAHRLRTPYRQALLECLNDHGTAYLDAVTVRSVGQVERIALDQVNWISAAGNYVELHCKERSVLHRVAIGKIDSRLDPAEFLRAHRTAIVRRTQCAAIRTVGDGRYLLRLHCGAQVPVSERHVDAVRACIRGEPDHRSAHRA